MAHKADARWRPVVIDGINCRGFRLALEVRVWGVRERCVALNSLTTWLAISAISWILLLDTTSSSPSGPSPPLAATVLRPDKDRLSPPGLPTTSWDAIWHWWIEFVSSGVGDAQAFETVIGLKQCAKRQRREGWKRMLDQSTWRRVCC